MELVWEFDDDDVGPSELNEDATIQEKLRYSEVSHPPTPLLVLDASGSLQYQTLCS